MLRPGMKMGFFAYNKFFTVSRPRVILIDENGRVLLVKHWGSWRRWSLPGGGVKKGELAEIAAQRELYEELGVEVQRHDLQYLTTVTTDYAAPIFTLKMPARALPPQPHNRYEIMEATWFSLDDLPAHLTKVAGKALTELSLKTLPSGPAARSAP